MSDHEAQPVRRDDEERAIGLTVDLLLVDNSGLCSVRHQFGERSVEVVDFEEAPLLRRIAAILSEPDGDTVACKYSSGMWRLAPRRYAKPEGLLIVWNRCGDIGDRERKRVVGIGHSGKKDSLH